MTVKSVYPVAIIIDGSEDEERCCGIINEAGDMACVARCQATRAGLLALCASAPSLVVVDASSNPPTAIEGVLGWALIANLKAATDGPKILALARENSYHGLYEALRAGADACITKKEALGATELMVSAIRALRAGLCALGGAQAAEVRRELVERHPFNMLRDRELTVLELVASGRDTYDIADELGLSPKTISNHLYLIYRVCGVSGMKELSRKLAWYRQ